MTESKSISPDQLRKLERRDVSPGREALNRFITVLPLLAGTAHLLEYKLVPNAGMNRSTNVYAVFLGFFLTILAVWFVISLFRDGAYDKLRYLSPFYVVVFLLLMAYDLATLKSGTLIMPYFPWLDRIFNSMIGDRTKLLDCVKKSLILLFTGYFGGVIAGLICGIGAGWSRRISYWIQPLVKILGAIPSTTYMPIVMILATSLFGGSAFLIGLGVWFPVTTSSINGVSNVHRNYYEVAQTLGTGKYGILFRVVIPASMPYIFTGLVQGMSTACLTLIVAEMMGVESGLGWYINWQKGWAEFSKMYGAIIIICITFILVNSILNHIKRRALRWQKGSV